MAGDAVRDRDMSARGARFHVPRSGLLGRFLLPRAARIARRTSGHAPLADV
ncbi:hypothetical protein C7S13_1509 [Burkholderia cepacia]|nr:hypothetical protein [Burkholderia cepacia]QOH33628.1 hypothetical protein C7S14_6224 [Burkholderia cepacia]